MKLSNLQLIEKYVYKSFAYENQDDDVENEIVRNFLYDNITMKCGITFSDEDIEYAKTYRQLICIIYSKLKNSKLSIELFG